MPPLGLIFDDCPLLEVNSGERLEVQAMQRLGRAEIDKSSDVTIHVPPSVTAKAGDFSMRSSRSSEVKARCNADHAVSSPCSTISANLS